MIRIDTTKIKYQTALLHHVKFSPNTRLTFKEYLDLIRNLIVAKCLHSAHNFQ
jgi:hypothetical protein